MERQDLLDELYKAHKKIVELELQLQESASMITEVTSRLEKGTRMLKRMSTIISLVTGLNILIFVLMIIIFKK